MDEPGYPYLAYQSLNSMIIEKSDDDSEFFKATRNYRQGINKEAFIKFYQRWEYQLFQVIEDQLFECVGLNQEVVDLCFCDTTNRLSQEQHLMIYKLIKLNLPKILGVKEKILNKAVF